MRVNSIVHTFSCVLFYVTTTALSFTDELFSYISVVAETSTCQHSAHPTCTTNSGAVANASCVFPFLVNNEKIWSCTREGGFLNPWCATKVDPEDCSMLPNQWGNCDEKTCEGVFEQTTTTAKPPACTNNNTDGNCLTIDGPQTNTPCWFPFSVQGVKHSACTTQGGYPEPWCATLVDDECNMVDNHWGTCNSSCPSEIPTTTVAPAPPPECNNTNTDCTTISGGDTCWFPFKIRDKIHYSCTFEGGYPQPWCPTRIDQNCQVDREHWGNCDPSCPNEKQSTTTPVPTTEITSTPTPEGCWYDYICSKIDNIGQGTGDEVVNASTCQAACKVLGNCNHLTWLKFPEESKCWFLETCEKQDICSSPEYCKSGPADCGDLTTTTDYTETSKTETTEISTTEPTEISTTIPPIPEDCWYDYICNKVNNIGQGTDEEVVSASTCQAACKALGNCSHFTWLKFPEEPKCWFLETCEKQKICSSPEHCKSGPADCGDLTTTAEHTDTSTTEHIETSTTISPTPDCWYDYICSKLNNIGQGTGEEIVSPYTCQAACKALGNCRHFTWLKFQEEPKCWFLETCEKREMCSSLDHCKSGPADC